MSSKIERISRALHPGWLKAALIAAGVIAYQWLVFRLIVAQPHSGWGGALMAAPLAVLGACVLARTRRGVLLLALLAVAAALGFLAWRASGASLAMLYPLPYVTVYLILLWLFGRTLLAPRQPLVTLLALHVHGELPVEIVRYTRRVTWAWCIFFAAMTATSLLLFAFAPLPVWSAFNSLLNLPLVAAMYLAEYAWRQWRYPDFSHASIATVVSAFRNFDFRRRTADR